MVDIHSHILPGFDDGARTLEEAIEMLRLAAASGTTDIVATSHSNVEFTFDPQRAEAAIAELQNSAAGLPRIHFGCELHFTPENVESILGAPRAWSIAHQGYVLIEFDDFLIPKTAGEILRHLSGVVRPILAHPERNPVLQRQVDRLESFVQQGCLVQVTAQSLSGRFGQAAKAAAEELLERNLVHCIASDAHNTGSRSPVLHEARCWVERRHSAELAVELFETNPRAVLAGTPIQRKPARKRSWFAFR